MWGELFFKVIIGKVYVEVLQVSPFFRDEKSPVEISVFILSRVSDSKLTQIADSIAVQRGSNRKFYGWAELSVANASIDAREVHATPAPENKWHADIVLPIAAKDDKKVRERHVNQLAHLSTLRPPEPIKE